MKDQYNIAENIISISAPDNLSPWQKLKPRYNHFITKPEPSTKAEEKPNPNPSAASFVCERENNDTPTLSIEIIASPIPEAEGERIYEPEYTGIGIISARASKQPDGSLAIEFLHINDGKPHTWMKMSPELNKAEIILPPDSDQDSPFFLTHAIMIAYLLATYGNGTLLIHSSAVLYEGKAYLFQGKSGTGKSTHARMWLENIPGTTLLNDDHPIIRISDDGTAKAYGSPWSGKTHCYKNVSAPIGAFVRIVRSDTNFLQPLPPLKAYASLMTSVFYLPLLTEKQREIRHKTIERLAMTVPCCEMHCLPNSDAAQVCLRGIMGLRV